MNLRTWGRKAMTLLPLVFFLLLILWVFLIPGHRYISKATQAQVDSGREWLLAQEARRGELLELVKVICDLVDAQLKAIRQAELDARRDEWLHELQTGVISVWSLFDDYALLGDSRTMGFSFYDYMPSERVLADSGATINKVADHLDELKKLSPTSIFLTYGINDVGIGYWPTPERHRLRQLHHSRHRSRLQARPCMAQHSGL